MESVFEMFNKIAVESILLLDKGIPLPEDHDILVAGILKTTIETTGSELEKVLELGRVGYLVFNWLYSCDEEGLEGIAPRACPAAKNLFEDAAFKEEFAPGKLAFSFNDGNLVVHEV